jgi:hypothetical protein
MRCMTKWVLPTSPSDEPAGALAPRERCQLKERSIAYLEDEV